MKAILLVFLILSHHLLANPNCVFEAKVHRESAQELILGITLTPKEHWHTYWSNPGDSGLALSIDLEDAGLKVEAEDFPSPIRFEAMGVVGYGYESAATFLYRLSGEIPKELKGVASWLVCDATACLPAEATFALEVTKVNPESPDWLIKARAKQPTEISTKEVEVKQAEGSKDVTYAFNTEENINGWLVFPYEESFTEGTFGNTVKRVGERYQMGFKVVGETPESPSFLITDGNTAHKITLDTLSKETEEEPEEATSNTDLNE